MVDSIADSILDSILDWFHSSYLDSFVEWFLKTFVKTLVHSLARRFRASWTDRQPRCPADWHGLTPVERGNILLPMDVGFRTALTDTELSKGNSGGNSGDSRRLLTRLRVRMSRC
jgi:hypothetical protein